MPEDKKNKSVVIKKEEETKIAPVENSADVLLTQALDKGLPVETIEKLVALRDKIEAKEAKKAFDNAMSGFQGECPIIKKTKGVPTKGGAIAFSYAPLDSIVRQVKPSLTKFGFSYTIQTETSADKVKATCIAKHRLGHTEESSMEVPLGERTPIMSKTQVVAAAITFATRYAFRNTFGIMTGDEDNEKILSDQSDKKDSTNYIDKLKMALYKKGGTDLQKALVVFNEVTGSTALVMPKNQKQAKEMLEAFLSSLEINKE